MICTRCGTECIRNSNSQKYCKVCSKKHFEEYNKEYQKIYQQKTEVKTKNRIRSKEYNNRPEIKERHKLWREENKEILKQKKKVYYQTNKIYFFNKNKKWKEENKERKKEMDILYYQKNKGRIKLYKQKPEIKKRIREYEQKKLNSDINFRVAKILRKFVSHSLKQTKSIKTSGLVGCSFEYFKRHIENQFDDNMNWDNYGVYGWHVDHIRPCASFDLSEEEEQLKCFHYTNLQPMWAQENWSKSAKYELT